MNITIAGSLGHIGKPLTQKLVKAGHKVNVISSSPERKAQIEELGANAAIGSVSDASFLTNAFKDADAVFAMTPPNLGNSQIIENTTNAGKAFAEAIRQSGVKRVVMLSSVGADLPGQNGPIAGLYNIEHLFNELDGVGVTCLRAGYFYINLYNDVPMIKGMNIMGGNYPANTRMPMVHTDDIASIAAAELEKSTTEKDVKYVVSDIKTPTEVVQIIGAAIGKPELNWVEFTDEQSLQGMKQAGLPEEVAKLYTEMGAGFGSGILTAHYFESGAPVTGHIKFESFAKEYAEKF